LIIAILMAMAGSFGCKEKQPRLKDPPNPNLKPAMPSGSPGGGADKSKS
jgi:hypothetical protein